MLKIGDFSRLAKVTVKALRHYADLGLLCPAWIDRYTGYRYYTLDQLPRLNRILALKDLGLSLEQIQRVLGSQVSADELRGMFYLKQAELQQKLVDEQMRLGRVAARLKQIEQEGHLAIEAVVVRRVEPLLVAFTLATAADQAHLAACRTAARALLENWLAAQGITPPGPWMVVYGYSEFVERDIPIEVAVGLDRLPRGPLPLGGRVQVRQLNAIPQAAIYAHTGPAVDLASAYHTLYGWVEANGYRVCGLAREVFLADGRPTSLEEPNPGWINATGQPAVAPPGAGEANQVVEVQLPVEPILFPANLKEPDMEPQIIERDSFLVAGTLYQGKNENQEIAAMWGNEFMPQMHTIQRTDNYVSYGVCEMDPSLPEGTVRYIAGVEVKKPEDAPGHFSLITVPGGKYAVFKHIGALEGLGKTYEYIYQVWLPQSGYQRDSRPDLEVYTNEFHDFQPDSILYLWVPVE